MQTQNVAFDASMRPYDQETARTHLLPEWAPVTFTSAPGKPGEEKQQLLRFECSINSLETVLGKNGNIGVVRPTPRGSWFLFCDRLMIAFWCHFLPT